MTELTLIKGKPKIFIVSSQEELVSTVKRYVENYDYEFVGSAFKEDIVFSEIDKVDPNLIFLDTDQHKTVPFNTSIYQ